MVFLPNIPQPTDDQSNSQGQLLGNNQQLDTSFAVDHYAFSDLTANNGKHKAVHLVNQSDPTTAAGEIAIYDKLVSAIPELFMRRASNGSVIQMTTGNPIRDFSTSGSTFLPGGFIIKFGKVVPNATTFPVNYAGLGLLAYPNGFIFETAIINVNSPSFNCNVDAGTVNGFNIITNAVGSTHFWLSIGY